MNYLNVAKSCGYNTTLGSCWHDAGVVKKLDGSVTADFDNNQSGLILSDGTLINFGWHSNANCNLAWGGQTIRWCNYIQIDVNGFKAPNMIGKDIFSVFILKDRIVPEGVQGDLNESSPANSCPDDGVTFGAYSNPGVGCAAKYLMN